MNALHVPCARGDFACLIRRPTQSKTSFLRLMRTPKIFSLFLPRKNFPSVSALQFLFCVLNGCIIYVNLNNKVRITQNRVLLENNSVAHMKLSNITRQLLCPPQAGKIFLSPPSQERITLPLPSVANRSHLLYPP